MAKETPITATKVSTSTVKAVEVSEGTKGAFLVGDKWLAIQSCVKGEVVPIPKMPAGEGPKAIHTRWKGGMPDPESEIQFAGGDGYLPPIVEVEK